MISTLVRPILSSFGLLFLALLLVPLPTSASSTRIVPQVAISNLYPVTSSFSPVNDDELLVLTTEGRVDIFDISNWSAPVKRLEIFAAAKSVAFGPDGRSIATGGRDGIVRIWNAVTGKLLGKPLRGHNSPILCLTFSPDGRSLVSGGEDNLIRFWNIDTMAPMDPPLSGHADPVTSLAYSTDGTRIASGDQDGKILLWDSISRTMVNTSFVGHQNTVTAIAFSPDGARLVSGSRDRSVALWSAFSGTQIGSPLEGHDDRVTGVQFSPDGTRIVSGSHDGTVRLWDVELHTAIEPALIGPHEFVESVAFDSDGTHLISAGAGEIQLWRVQRATQSESPFDGTRLDVESVAFSGSSRTFVSGNPDGTVQLWDAVNLSPIGNPVTSNDYRTRSVAFSADGKFVASGGASGTITIWSVENGLSEIVSFEGHSGAVFDLDFNFDSTIVVSAGYDNSVRLWDVNTGTAIGEPMTGHKREAKGVSFAPSGQYIASGSLDGSLIIWDAFSQKVVRQIHNAASSGIESVAFSPDGNRIVTGAVNGTLQSWSFETGEQLGSQIHAHDRGVTGLAFSRDGKSLASAGSFTLRLWYGSSLKPKGDPLETSSLEGDISFDPSGTRIAIGSRGTSVQLWQLEVATAVGNPLRGYVGDLTYTALDQNATRSVGSSQEGPLRIWQLDGNGSPVRQLWQKEGWVDSVWDTALSLDGTNAAAALYEGDILLWRFSDNDVSEYRIKGHEETVWTLDFNPNADRLASGDYSGTVRLWEVGSEPIELWSRKVQEDAVRITSFSRDGTRIASGGDDGIVRVLNAATGDIVSTTEPGHHGWITSLSVSSDGRLVVSGGAQDSAIRVWSTETGKPAAKPLFGHVGWVTGVAINPDATRIVSLGEDATIRLWSLNSGTQIESSPVCPSFFVDWSRSDAIVVACDDRLLVLTPDLEVRGQVMLFDTGIAAFTHDFGVYAVPLKGKDHTIRFEYNKNLGVPEAIDYRTLRELLFQEYDFFARIRAVIRQGLLKIRGAHVSLGHAAWPVWGLLIWLLLASIAFLMGALFPAKLAWWAMSSRSESFSKLAVWPWKNLLFVRTVFFELGCTRRSLKAWLQQNRKVLEDACFTGRQPVVERGRYLALHLAREIEEFSDSVTQGRRALVWIDGVGGSGKTSLGIFLLRSTVLGILDRPVPVFVGEDWSGSLAGQVAKQLRHREWKVGPTERMVRVLGANGLICPMVDAISERGMVDAFGLVKDAVAKHDFRHLIVTGRHRPPSDQIWQAFQHVSSRNIGPEDVPQFVRIYTDKSGQTETESVIQRIERLLSGSQMPSPLFLRFAVEQAAQGPLDAVDRLSLVLHYIEAVRESGVELSSVDMKRAAAVAAVVSVQNDLVPREFSEQRLVGALHGEGNIAGFFDSGGKLEIAAPGIVEMLVRSGLLNRGTDRLQFAYDPVAEYLVAWWVLDGSSAECRALKKRIEREGDTEVGRAFREIVETERRAV